MAQQHVGTSRLFDVVLAAVFSRFFLERLQLIEHPHSVYCIPLKANYTFVFNTRCFGLSLAVLIDVQLKEAYEQMQAQPTASGSQGMSDESGTDNDSKVGRTKQGSSIFLVPR